MTHACNAGTGVTPIKAAPQEICPMVISSLAKIRLPRPDFSSQPTKGQGGDRRRGIRRRSKQASKQDKIGGWLSSPFSGCSVCALACSCFPKRRPGQLQATPESASFLSRLLLQREQQPAPQCRPPCAFLYSGLLTSPFALSPVPF